MKIDYPVIEWADVREGDTVLAEFVGDGKNRQYEEFEVGDKREYSQGYTAAYYLIDRPKEKFPEEGGTLIIAKKVRGEEFPEGIVLRRNNAVSGKWDTVYWISQEQVSDIGQYGRTRTYDRHPESKIEDWVLAKVVPA
jgi:hypothetical protein